MVSPESGPRFSVNSGRTENEEGGGSEDRLVKSSADELRYPRVQITLRIERVWGLRSRIPFSLLITDDDDALRESLQSVFEKEGFHTVLARSGEEAIDIVGHQPVHLALLDYHLPRLTGLETLRIMRQKHALLPAILVTAESSEELVREALSAQVFSVLSKPVTRSQVVTTVEKALACHYQSILELRGGADPEAEG